MKFTSKLSLGLLISLLPIAVLTQPPDFGLLGDNRSYFLLQLSAYFGFFGAILVLWQIALGSRRFITKLAPGEQEDVLKFHKLLGKYGFLLVVMHPLLVAQTYATSRVYVLLPNFGSEFETHVTFGRFAYLVLFTVWLTSTVLRSKLKYRPWKYIHLAAYAIFPFVFIHAGEIGTNLRSSQILKGYWTILGIIYLALILSKLYYLLNIGGSKYKIVKKEKLAPTITQLTLAPISKGLAPKPGQYIYLKPGLLSESHPFSVSSYDPKTNKLQITFKIVGGFTSKLSRQSKAGDKLLMDGPYGKFTAELEDNADTNAVFISGGIGITPFRSHCVTRDPAKTILISATRDLDLAVFRAEFKASLKNNYFEFVKSADKDGKQVINRRLTGRDVARIAAAKKFAKDKTAYYICGPPVMMDLLTAQLLEQGVELSNIRTERFSH